MAVCPCQNGTLVATKDITVSGVTMLGGALAAGYDVNDTYSPTSTSYDQCIMKYSEGFGLGPLATIQVWFTRLETWTYTLFGSTTQYSFSMAPGVKAVFDVIVTALGAGGGTTRAHWVKVIPDTNSFIDCDADITGAVFEEQRSLDSPTMDASGGTVSYQ